MPHPATEPPDISLLVSPKDMSLRQGRSEAITRSLFKNPMSMAPRLLNESSLYESELQEALPLFFSAQLCPPEAAMETNLGTCPGSVKDKAA